MKVSEDFFVVSVVAKLMSRNLELLAGIWCGRVRMVGLLMEEG